MLGSLPSGFISPFEVMMMNFSSPSSLSAQLRALPTAGGGATAITTAMIAQQINSNDIPASHQQTIFEHNQFSEAAAHQEVKALAKRRRLQQQHQHQLHLQQQNSQQLTNFQAAATTGNTAAGAQQHHQPDYAYIQDAAAQLSVDVKTGRLGRGGSGGAGYSSTSSNSASSSNNPAAPSPSTSPLGGGGGGGGNSNVGNGISNVGGGSGMSIGGPVANVPRMSASAAYSSARNKRASL